MPFPRTTKRPDKAASYLQTFFGILAGKYEHGSGGYFNSLRQPVGPRTFLILMLLGGAILFIFIFGAKPHG